MSLPPPLPRGESCRLSLLRSLDVLDTPKEAFTQSVVAAAAAIVNTPLAAISLVDDRRQWFKGSVGIKFDETSRDVSFCAYAIARPEEPLIVNDALEDPRFHDNPLVTGAPFIRFYAGFPLIVRGEAVGALCIMDDRPRVLGADERVRLQELARGTAAWLETREAERPVYPASDR